MTGHIVWGGQREGAWNGGIFLSLTVMTGHINYTGMYKTSQTQSLHDLGNEAGP